MKQKISVELLNDERFLNYCFQKNKEDQEYWENYLSENSDQKEELTQLKDLAFIIAELSSQKEESKEYEKLLQRIENPKIKKMVWVKRLSIAASLLFVLSAGLYFFSINTTSSRLASNKKNDIGPGKNKAILILADGSKLNLDDAATGKVAEQGNLVIAKNPDGSLTYIPKQAEDDSAEGINTIQTPAQAQFSVVLADGTKVLLNSLSSLSYPSKFSKEIRKVKLKGEAFFDVAHVYSSNRKMRIPFIVETQGGKAKESQQIEVLGTEFNVNSYPDEPVLRTSLVEGLVKVVSGGSGTSKDGKKEQQTVILKPGQEAISSGEAKLIVKSADLENVTAWKNGDFVFHEDLETALRKISRWYDVNIEYEKGVNRQHKIGGWISRKKNLSEVLAMIEQTGGVQFEIDGRRVLVKE